MHFKTENKRETPENIGLIARAMKNFGLNTLILVNPKCDYLSEKVFATAMHASDIVKKIKVVSCAPLFAEVMHMVQNNNSISGKFLM